MKQTLLVFFISGFLSVCYAQKKQNNFSEQTVSLKEVKVYPNPASNYFSVSGIASKENFFLYNILGKGILRGTLNSTHRIDISNLNKGVYLLRLESGKSFKLMKE